MRIQDHKDWKIGSRKALPEKQINTVLTAFWNC